MSGLSAVLFFKVHTRVKEAAASVLLSCEAERTADKAKLAERSLFLNVHDDTLQGQE
ncbi:hypothetical protein [Roseibium sp.]|uniref:hypothetical protein n=1 Tax=Roseibium sp. TaxID=1936156 RepID=UPI001AFE8F9C|nr:hypothetical protein [Roseibium sp.]MBO6858135.1 hypothetical protein [Roseibium sp.]